MDNCLGNAANLCCDYRPAGCHGLKNAHGKRLAFRRQNEDVGKLKHAGHIPSVPKKVNAIRKRILAGKHFQSLRKRSITQEKQLDSGLRLTHGVKCTKEMRVAFIRMEVCHAYQSRFCGLKPQSLTSDFPLRRIENRGNLNPVVNNPQPFRGNVHTPSSTLGNHV